MPSLSATDLAKQAKGSPSYLISGRRIRAVGFASKAFLGMWPRQIVGFVSWFYVSSDSLIRDWATFWTVFTSNSPQAREFRNYEKSMDCALLHPCTDPVVLFIYSVRAGAKNAQIFLCQPFGFCSQKPSSSALFFPEEFSCTNIWLLLFGYAENSRYKGHTRY